MKGVYRKVTVLATVGALLGGVGSAGARPPSAYREYDSALFVSGGFKLAFPKKGGPQEPRSRGEEEAVSPVLLPLSVSSFRTVGNPIMPKRVASGVSGLDADTRRQLEAALLTLLREYEQLLDRNDDPRLKNNLAGAFNHLFLSSYKALKGGGLTPEQQKSMLMQLNAGFALGLKERRLSDREKQELYESAVLSGSIILGLYNEGRDKDRKTARELARALLEQLMGITPERIHTDGDSVWID
ncbi:DUF6683 family protein [Melittangium boletus]|uniref:Uncharacterized protein n=1 Tax=Melittangium boletus DSM 14713 TaxID=1294270 RepID=A0A250IA91_9BACT|nr:DUF6683 family protein [Melittangium boletus]ATB28081.1 hypothetical protein MEBOL_001526 [Melittangium boletus DSM 14713]